MIDCEKNDHKELVHKLNIYKLRSKIEIRVNNKLDIYSIYGKDLDTLTSNLKVNYKEGFTKEVSDNLFSTDIPHVVVDMPFGSYEESPEVAFRSASKIMRETGAQSVKLEGGEEFAETIFFLNQRGIPVIL